MKSYKTKPNDTPNLLSECFPTFTPSVATFHISSSPPGQNGHHFPDDIYNFIFMNEKYCISIKMSRKFVPKGPINNILALI